jgi:hypothetical protein
LQGQGVIRKSQYSGDSAAAQQVPESVGCPSATGNPARV